MNSLMRWDLVAGGFVEIDHIPDSGFREGKFLNGIPPVQGLNNGCDKAAHTDAHVIRAFQKFRLLINQVGGKHSVKQSFFVGFVKLLQTVGKQAEGRKEEYPFCMKVSQNSLP